MRARLSSDDGGFDTGGGAGRNRQSSAALRMSFHFNSMSNHLKAPPTCTGQATVSRLLLPQEGNTLAYCFCKQIKNKLIFEMRIKIRL